MGVWPQPPKAWRQVTRKPLTEAFPVSFPPPGRDGVGTSSIVPNPTDAIFPSNGSNLLSSIWGQLTKYSIFQYQGSGGWQWARKGHETWTLPFQLTWGFPLCLPFSAVDKFPASSGHAPSYQDPAPRLGSYWTFSVVAVWTKGNPPTLLVGVSIGTATIENSWEVSKNRVTTWSSNPTPACN